jgi:PKHD-type hydroxylase
MYLLRNKDVDPVCWVDNFLSDDEIKTLISHVDGLSTIEGRINSVDNDSPKYSPKYSPKERITSIKWVELNSEINWLYAKLVDVIKRINLDNFDMTLKFLEPLQFSEYNQKRKSFYKIHSDCEDGGDLTSSVDIRKLSFSIQLTDEKKYEGGELIIYKDRQELVAPKSKGTIIFFESRLKHEVKPVTKGVRHSLVGWVQGPNLR